MGRVGFMLGLPTLYQSQYLLMWWAESAGTTSSLPFVLSRLCRQWGCRYVAEGQAWWLYNDWCGSHDEGSHLWRTQTWAPPKTKSGWMKKLNRCFARGFCPAGTFRSPVVLQNLILPVFYFSFYFLFRTFRIDLKKFSNGKWKMWVNPKDSILGAIVALRSIMHFPENPAADNSCFPATRHKILQDDSSK